MKELDENLLSTSLIDNIAASFSMRQRFELEKLAQENGKRKQARFPAVFYALVVVFLSVSYNAGVVNAGTVYTCTHFIV